MFLAILILLAMPFTDLSRSRGIQFRPFSKIAFFIFVVNFLILMQLGAKHVESPFIEFGQVSTVIFFSHFLVIVPILSLFENSLLELSSYNYNTLDSFNYIKTINTRKPMFGINVSKFLSKRVLFTIDFVLYRLFPFMLCLIIYVYIDLSQPEYCMSNRGMPISDLLNPAIPPAHTGASAPLAGDALAGAAASAPLAGDALAGAAASAPLSGDAPAGGDPSSQSNPLVTQDQQDNITITKKVSMAEKI